MNFQKDKIYIYNDDISFRLCTLFNNPLSISQGNCTNYEKESKNWELHYFCKQDGVHFHCTKHPNVELDIENNYYGSYYLKCKQCNNEIEVSSIQDLINNCLKCLNSETFKDCDLIRVDDWYIPEVKNKVKNISDYWITTEVKKDKDNATIIIVYVGKTGENKKVQYFIKPEKLQLTNDFKDKDPGEIISKIEVTLKDRTLIQEYD